MKKSRVGRLSIDLYDLLSSRTKRFNTSMMTEQTNLVKIVQELEHQMGLDVRKVSVVNGKPKLHTKHKVVVFK